MSGRRIARGGVLIAVALVLSYIEAQLPAFLAVPGVKLGLTNLAVLMALCLLGEGAALAVNLVRIVLVSLLFGNGMAFVYSLAGGMLSTLVMILLRRTGRFRLMTISIAGGLAHNLGQIAAAAVLLRTRALAWYLPVLWFSGLAAGAVIGVLGGVVCARLAPWEAKER